MGYSDSSSTELQLKKPSLVLWRFGGCVFRSALGWLGERKKCKQTHPIWDGFFSDSLYAAEMEVVTNSNCSILVYNTLFT